MDKLTRQLDPLNLDRREIRKIYNKFMRELDENGEVPIDKLAELLSQHSRMDIATIRNVFTKMINRPKISWDKLLEYFHSDSILRSTILDEKIEPVVSVMLGQVEPCNDINRQLKRINKEARFLQEHTLQNNQYTVILTENEVLFMNREDGKLSLQLNFKGQYDGQSLKSQQSQNTSNVNMQNTSGVNFTTGILTHHMKKSLKLNDRAESPHQRKSVTESAFSLNKITKKREFERVKKSNMDHIFSLFKELPHDKTLDLCRLYTESDQPEILIDRNYRNYLQPKNNQPSPSTSHDRSNYLATLEMMKKQKVELSYNPRRLSLGESVLKRRSSLVKSPKPVRNKITAMQNTAKKRNAFILGFCLHNNLIAVTLATKELRILKMRKYFFNKVITEEVFRKSYAQPPLFVHIYECRIRQDVLFIMMALEEANKVKIVVKELDQAGKPSSVIFSQELDFYPIFQVVEGTGVACFNELGRLSVVEFSSIKSKETVRMTDPIQMNNPSMDKKMPISTVRYHKKTLCWIIGCLDGFLYAYSSIKIDEPTELKRVKKLSSKSIVSIEIDDRQIVTLAADNKCRLLHLTTFEMLSQIDLNDNKISAIRGLFWKNSNTFIVYGVNVAKVSITQDAKKQSNFVNRQEMHKQIVRMYTQGNDSQMKSINPESILQTWISNGFVLVLMETGVVSMIKIQDIRNKARFFLHNPRSVIQICVCRQGNVYGRCDEDFQVSILNVYTQQKILSLKCQGTICLFLPSDIKYSVCAGNNRGECLLYRDQKTQQLIKNRGEITVCRVVNKMLILGNDRGVVSIYTRNLYSLKHSIKLSEQPIKEIKQEQGIIVVLSDAIHQIDPNDGKILSFQPLQQRKGYKLVDYTSKSYCLMGEQDVRIFYDDGDWKESTIKKQCICCFFKNTQQVHLLTTDSILMYSAYGRRIN